MELREYFSALRQARILVTSSALDLLWMPQDSIAVCVVLAGHEEPFQRVATVLGRRIVLMFGGDPTCPNTNVCDSLRASVAERVATLCSEESARQARVEEAAHPEQLDKFPQGAPWNHAEPQKVLAAEEGQSNPQLHRDGQLQLADLDGRPGLDDWQHEEEPAQLAPAGNVGAGAKRTADDDTPKDLGRGGLQDDDAPAAGGNAGEQGANFDTVPEADSKLPAPAAYIDAVS
jgi:hypothetical protein